MSTFFTSDTHFGHDFVARLRGFNSTDEHDSFLISRWNSVVTPADTVYHLGDFSLFNPSRLAPYVSALNGNIVLIAGNHDMCWHRRSRSRTIRRALNKVEDYLSAGFHQVHTSGTVLYRLPSGQVVLLSHLPTSGDHGEDRYSDRRPSTPGLVVCGHVHGTFLTDANNYNVGVDVHGFAPIPLETVQSYAFSTNFPDVDPSCLFIDGPWTELGCV